MFSILIVRAQNTDNEKEVLEINRKNFITLSQIENGNVQSLNHVISQDLNNIYIEQVGTDNTIYTSITAQSSDIKLYQTGNNNTIDITEYSKNIEKEIIQTGTYNTVIDYSFNRESSTNLELIQEGSNLNFERFGTNELSKSLKFKMTGNAKTIIC